MKVSTLGIDLAKNDFQLHGVDTHDEVAEMAPVPIPLRVPITTRGVVVGVKAALTSIVARNRCRPLPCAPTPDTNSTIAQPHSR